MLVKDSVLVEKRTVSVSVWALRRNRAFQGRQSVFRSPSSFPSSVWCPAGFSRSGSTKLLVGRTQGWQRRACGRAASGPFQPLLNPLHLCLPCRRVADQAGLLLHRAAQSCQSAVLRPLRQGEPPGRTPGRPWKLLVPMPLPHAPSLVPLPSQPWQEHPRLPPARASPPNLPPASPSGLPRTSG